MKLVLHSAQQIDIQKPPSRLKAQEARFVLFMIETEPPITNQAIYEWYKNYVMNPSGFWARQDYLDKLGKPSVCWASGTAEEILKERSLKWFDSWLGRCIRKGVPFSKEHYVINKMNIKYPEITYKEGK